VPDGDSSLEPAELDVPGPIEGIGPGLKAAEIVSHSFSG
jgi:hypothetical protein